MAMVEHIFLMSATARGALAAACVLSFAVSARALDAGDTLRVMTFNVRGCTDETGVRNVAQTANRNLPVSDCAGRVQWRVRRDASEADILSFAVEALLRGSVSTVTTIFSYNIRKTI